jgi:CMP-N,N'-diacetyllegionaminic acid synthase
LSKPVVLAVVPARAGSKGVPGKNLRKLGGLPLVAWSTRSALKARRVTDVVATSDSRAILAAAAVSERVIRVVRPKALASDKAPILPTYRHAVLEYEKATGRAVDWLVGLEPTTPLRKPEDIDGCVARAVAAKADLAVAVKATSENPYFVQVEPKSKGSAWHRQVKRSRAMRRQDAPPVYTINGAVYVIKRSVLFRIESIYDAAKLAVFEMPWARSVDLDSENDFELAEFLLSRGWTK